MAITKTTTVERIDVIPAREQKETFDKIQNIYKDVKAKYPELYNKVIH